MKAEAPDLRAGVLVVFSASAYGITSQYFQQGSHRRGRDTHALRVRQGRWSWLAAVRRPAAALPPADMILPVQFLAATIRIPFHSRELHDLWGRMRRQPAHDGAGHGLCWPPPSRSSLVSPSQSMSRWHPVRCLRGPRSRRVRLRGMPRRWCFQWGCAWDTADRPRWCLRTDGRRWWRSRPPWCSPPSPWPSAGSAVKAKGGHGCSRR